MVARVQHEGSCAGTYNRSGTMTYQNRLAVHRGGQARSVKGAKAREHIKRELHGLAIAVQGNRTVATLAKIAPRSDVNVVDWWTDVRRQRQTVYGSLFRFIDIAIRLGTPKSVLMVIPEVIASYINDETDEAALTPPSLTVEHGRAA